jgi:ABC-type lipoprotein export system ATPase subunit
MILLQTFSDLSRQRVKGRIEETVNQALNIIYGGNHQFTIELEPGKNGPEAYYYLNDGVHNGQLKKPRFHGVSGGKIDIISFVLWLSVIELTATKGVLVADEPGHNLDAVVVPNMGYFLKEYCGQFARQIVLTTHHEALSDIGDKSMYILKKNDISEVKNL